MDDAGLDGQVVADEFGREAGVLGRDAAASPIVPPDFARVHTELRREGVTLMLLWQEDPEAQAA